MNVLVQSCRTLSSASLIAIFGCSAAPAGSGEKPEDVGEVSLALTTVPTGVQCIQVVARGSSTVTKNFTVTAGSNGVNALALGALPVGSVTITGQAYNVACSGISGQTPTWVADSLTINVQGGVITSPSITFRPNNAVTATANFVGNIVQVASSSSTIDIVYSDGTVRGSGYQGALGLGQLTTFTALSGLTNVASLALGSYNFGCALLKTGTVACFGDNTYGQLGNGTTTSSTTPVAVTGLTNITQIATGAYHACAVKSDGTLWCWGYNVFGQVGNGSTTNVTSPVQVWSSAAFVAAGAYHTCAGNSGIRCWGYNAYGQLGIGSTTSPVTTPQYVSALPAVSQLALGSYHSCALRPDGAAFCWGNNGYGQLGYGDTTQLLAPSTTPVITNVQQLTTTTYGACALLKGGYVMCWGYDYDGAVGDGTGTVAGILSPTYVANNYATFTSLFTSTGDTNCGIGADSKVYCWGTNLNWQIANSYLPYYYVPTALGI